MIPDPEREDPPPFTPGFAVVLTLGATFLQLALLVMLVGATRRPVVSLAGIAAIVGFGSMFALGVQRLQGPPAEALGLRAAPGRAWVAALLLLPSILLVSELDNMLQTVAPMPDQTGQAPEADGVLLMIQLAVVVIAVLPPIRELFFRGMIQPRITERLGRLRGVLATALLAVLASAPLASPWELQRTFWLALVLGLLRECSGSIGPGLLLHVGFGTFGVLASFEVFGIPGFDDLSQPHTPLEWLLPAALTTGAGLRICQSLLVETEPISSPDAGP